MGLTLIAIAVVGFFFPPAWLLLAGFIIYLFASRKSRRDDAIESRIKQMLSQGRERAEFSDLYFEAARSYAVAKGAIAPDQNAASAKVLINGHSYSAMFTRGLKGGTAIFVRTTDAINNELVRDLNERLKHSNLKDEQVSESAMSPEQYVENFVQSFDADRSIDIRQLQSKPSFVHNEFELEEFMAFLFSETAYRGIPQTYTVSMCLDRNYLNILFHCVARAEKSGSDKVAMREIGLAFVIRSWDRLNDAAKSKARNIPFNDDSFKAIKEISSGLQ